MVFLPGGGIWRESLVCGGLRRAPLTTRKIQLRNEWAEKRPSFTPTWYLYQQWFVFQDFSKYPSWVYADSVTTWENGSKKKCVCCFASLRTSAKKLCSLLGENMNLKSRSARYITHEGPKLPNILSLSLPEHANSNDNTIVPRVSCNITTFSFSWKVSDVFRSPDAPLSLLQRRERFSTDSSHWLSAAI